MEEFYKGLYITVFGMGLVFLSLSLIMGAIWAMERIFGEKEENIEEEAPVQVIIDQGRAEEDEVAAAIAAGLLVLQEEETHQEQGKWMTVASGNGGTSAWTSAGRQILMNSRHITRGAKR